MEANSESVEDLQKLVAELKEDIAEIYQYYHGDPPQLQKIFDKWFPDGLPSSFPFG